MIAHAAIGSQRSVRALAFAGLLLLSACESLPELGSVLSSPGDGSLSENTIAAGLREALEVGAGRSVELLGRKDGFARSAYRIPLPDKLNDARDIAKPFGLDGMFDELEDKMNDAAEAAAPKAQRLFIGAIRQMTFSDVMSIYRGSDDAATRFLERATAAQLNREMLPIIDDSLAEVGAVTTFTSLADSYNKLPFVKPVEADLSSHVAGYASAALFTQLATEEAAIRRDPVKRSTELLRRVFAERG